MSTNKMKSAKNSNRRKYVLIVVAHDYRDVWYRGRRGCWWAGVFELAG